MNIANALALIVDRAAFVTVPAESFETIQKLRNRLVVMAKSERENPRFLMGDHPADNAIPAYNVLADDHVENLVGRALMLAWNALHLVLKSGTLEASGLRPGVDYPEAIPTMSWRHVFINSGENLDPALNEDAIVRYDARRDTTAVLWRDVRFDGQAVQLVPWVEVFDRLYPMSDDPAATLKLAASTSKEGDAIRPNLGEWCRAYLHERGDAPYPSQTELLQAANTRFPRHRITREVGRKLHRQFAPDTVRHRDGRLRSGKRPAIAPAQ